MAGRAALVSLVLAVVVALLQPAAPVHAPAMAGTALIPDLAVAPLEDFQIQESGGRRLLRFSSTMVNVGAGHFELRGMRPSPSGPMAVHQVIYDTTARDAPIVQDIATPATATYSGDGHDHWHIDEMVRFDLWGESGSGVLRGSKIGFCFLDTDPYDFSLPGASPSPYYSGSWCGSDPNALANRMGMSVGWGDEYDWFLPMQWVDITGLPSGTYNVRARVDPNGYFLETDEFNQCAYVTVALSESSNAVGIVGSGAACIDDWSGSPFAADIGWAFANGITTGCAPDFFCPNDPVPRQQMASFLARARALPPPIGDYFVDDAGSIHEADINRVREAGIAFGCGAFLFCPAQTVTREQMASFLARARSLPPPIGDYFVDDAGSPHEADINSAYEAGITFGCGAFAYCPTTPVTRGQMSAFLHRAFGG
jgi:Lysyl oxidase/S-layer homology domain